MATSRAGAESESAKEDYTIPFEHGESASAALIRALTEDLANNGGEAISLLRRKHPQDYVKIILSLEQRTETGKGPLDDVSDDELKAFIKVARDALAAGDNPA